MRRKFILTTLLSSALLLPLAVHAEGATGGKTAYTDDQVRNFTRTETLPGGMKVNATVLALHKHQKDIDRVFATAFSELRQLSENFATNNPNSEISRLNSQAVNGPVKVSEATIKLLQVAKKAQHATNNAYEIVKVGSNSPDDIKINAGAQTVQFLKPGMQIDVASVVDGFLADRLMQVLWDANIDNAMVEVGNVTRSIGNDLVGPWRKVVADMTGQYAGRGVAISFSNASTATVSVGANEPKTGARKDGVAATKCRSATVIAKDATTAQAVANAIYNLGPEQGLELANRIPQVRALIRDNAGNLVKSPGL